MYSYIPEFIYEGVIQEIDYEAGTCVVAPLNSRKDNEIKEVAIPFLAGSGNSGVWSGNLKRGSRVVLANTSGAGEQFAVILSNIPQKNKFANVFNRRKPGETPSGSVAYPKLVEGRVVIRGDQGSEVCLSESGDVFINAGGGGAGEYFKKFNVKSVASYKVAHEHSSFSNAGRFYQGTVRRLASNKRNYYPKSTLNEAPLFVDLDFHNVATPVGFFNGSKCFKYTYGNKKRNPEIAEHRTVINEFSTESIFTGFDDEVARIKNEKQLFENSDSFERYREPSNTLQLAEHELIEIVGGNLVDFKGNILDLNYRSIAYGSPGNKTPKKNIETNYGAAKILSRRGIGYHFMLSTNVDSNQVSTTSNSFIFDIDKEGLLRLNIPKSSDTGNIPFPALTTFEDGSGGISTEYSNPSTLEPIPVTLRDQDGNVVLPPTADRLQRETGIRFTNSDNNPYFPAAGGGDGSGTIRVNTTKYHNMYAIAERLIANNISKIEIPESFTNDNGFIDGLPLGKPYEIFDSEEETSELIGDLNSAEFQLPTFMSVVRVVPGAPGMYSGGDTVVAGANFTDDDLAQSYSNSFVLEEGESGDLEARIVDPVFGDDRERVGGKSAVLNFEGSVESSIGRDNTDKKSLVLDTAGSVLAWFGLDANGRSLIMQTDGEMLINVGGSYRGTDPDERTMNVGRFTLRVNVTDKGHIGTEFEAGEDPKANSDFVIDISDEGMVIAGMKQGAPMVIRNEGKILIESSTDLVLKGNKVEQVTSKGKSTTPNVPGRG